MTRRPEAFDVAIERHGATLVAAPRGELDIATLPVLRERLADLGDPEQVVMDLRALTFLDSMSIEFFLRLREELAAAGARLVLVRGPRAVDRLFRVMRLDQVLEIVDEPPLPAAAP
jgi:anti-anti-sigma factor